MLPFKRLIEEDLCVSDSTSSDNSSDDESCHQPSGSILEPSTKFPYSSTRSKPASVEVLLNNPDHTEMPGSSCQNPPPASHQQSSSDSDIANSSTEDLNPSEPKERTTVYSPFYCLGESARRDKKYKREFFEKYAALKHDYKRIKKTPIPEKLSEFMPTIPDVIDNPEFLPEGSTLSSLQKFCPLGNLNLKPLTALDLEAFRLHPGPLPAQYRMGDDKAAALAEWPQPAPSPASSDPASCASEEDEPVEMPPTKMSQKAIKASLKALQKASRAQKKAANKLLDVRESKDERKKATKKKKL